MIRVEKSFFYLFLTVLLLISCGKDDTQVITSNKRLVFVYMIADNNLDYFAIQDINEMEKGLFKSPEDKLLVYLDRGEGGNPSHPYLMEIVPDSTELVVSKILRTYPEQNSVSKSVIKKVLDEAFNHFKDESFTSKGLVLWSHGSGWLPKDFSVTTSRDKLFSQEITKSFGVDDVPIEEASVNIKDLKHVLEKHYFDFILFDACFMSSIEVLYDFRHITDYIIASPTETLSDGFPYQTVVPFLFEEELKPIKIAESYFEHYNEKQGILNSSSIAVVKMNELKKLTQKIKEFYYKLSLREQIFIGKDKVQKLDRLNSSIFFDLKDFLARVAKNNKLESNYQKIEEQWQRTIIYQNNSPFIMNTVNLDNSNGVSTFIPDTKKYKKLNAFYKTLPWFKDSGYNKIFPNI